VLVDCLCSVDYRAIKCCKISSNPQPICRLKMLIGDTAQMPLRAAEFSDYWSKAARESRQCEIRAAIFYIRESGNDALLIILKTKKSRTEDSLHHPPLIISLLKGICHGNCDYLGIQRTFPGAWPSPARGSARA
jgi:hypothetical protein